jgi:hypothetical protein
MGRAALTRLRGEWRGADPRCSVEAPEARSGRRSASRSLKMSRMSANNIAPVDWSSLAPAIAAKTRRARSGAPFNGQRTGSRIVHPARSKVSAISSPRSGVSGSPPTSLSCNWRHSCARMTCFWN